MERKRQKATTKSAMSSPPRSTKSGSATAPDIVSRTFDLVTSKAVLPFYILAGGFSFYYGPKACSFPSPRPLEFVVFKLLPLVYLMELVRRRPQTICPVHDHARRYILLGLFVSIIGDALLAYKPDVLMIIWFGTTCIAYVCYTIAFYQYYQEQTNKWAKAVFPLGAVLAASLIYQIREPKLSGLIALYTLFLVVLGYFALSRLETCRTAPAYLGWAGVKLFTLSSYLFALNFLSPSSDSWISDTVIIMAYFLGQLGIALSTYTIPLCPVDEPSNSSPLESDSSASVNLSRG
ncbi:hypothetical protein RRG08_034270 [Elysia crispata]|uniref:lysoplasmalogenase n=1 Tax=Elysia crispata TaxID=231223 RepID=A0AAE1DQH4_9GAST|nr:hypothetical protein RRG08_034270 [Elysia crispata]